MGYSVWFPDTLGSHRNFPKSGWIFLTLVTSFAVVGVRTAGGGGWRGGRALMGRHASWQKCAWAHEGQAWARGPARTGAILEDGCGSSCTATSLLYQLQFLSSWIHSLPPDTSISLPFPGAGKPFYRHMFHVGVSSAPCPHVLGSSYCPEDRWIRLFSVSRNKIVGRIQKAIPGVEPSCQRGFFLPSINLPSTGVLQWDPGL